MRRTLVLALALLLAAPGLARGADEQDLASLKKDMQRQIAAGDAAGAALYASKIARLDDPKAVSFLVEVGLAVDQYSGMEPSEALQVFESARDALAGVTDPEARAWLFKEARRGKRPADADRKVFLTEVIAGMSGEDAEDVLIELLAAEKFPAVQITALESLARRRSVKAVDPVIRLLEEKEPKGGLIWKIGLDALAGITGYRFQRAGDWRNFWDVRGETWDPGRDRGDDDRRGGQERTVARKLPRILGVEIASKRFVFIIDISKSMHHKEPAVGGEQPSGPPQGGKREHCPICDQEHLWVGLPDSRMRIERVKRELIAMLKELESDVRFNILAYSTEVWSWAPGNSLVPASDSNRARAIDWVQKLEYQAFTSTDYALDRAFEFPEANTFYLLSDGTPMRGKDALPKQPILDAVRMRNRARKVKIHTIGFTSKADHEFLRQLSRENGGEFTAAR